MQFMSHACGRVSLVEGWANDRREERRRSMSDNNCGGGQLNTTIWDGDKGRQRLIAVVCAIMASLATVVVIMTTNPA